MARTPPGRTSLAMVANRWMASMSRCIIDTDASTMRVSHKTARADPSMRGFANSPWTPTKIRQIAEIFSKKLRRRVTEFKAEFEKNGTPFPVFHTDEMQ